MSVMTMYKPDVSDVIKTEVHKWDHGQHRWEQGEKSGPETIHELPNLILLF